MWEKFIPMHTSRDTVHAQWLQMHCQWSLTQGHTLWCMIFKLGGGVDCVTRHAKPLTKVKRSKVKVTRSHNVSAEATGGLINFKLGENFRHEWRNT